LFELLDKKEDLGFENELVTILGRIRQMDAVQRDLYISAIKGMLPK